MMETPPATSRGTKKKRRKTPKRLTHRKGSQKKQNVAEGMHHDMSLQADMKISETVSSPIEVQTPSEANPSLCHNLPSSKKRRKPKRLSHRKGQQKRYTPQFQPRELFLSATACTADCSEEPSESQQPYQPPEPQQPHQPPKRQQPHQPPERQQSPEPPHEHPEPQQPHEHPERQQPHQPPERQQSPEPPHEHPEPQQPHEHPEPQQPHEHPESQQETRVDDKNFSELTSSLSKCDLGEFKIIEHEDDRLILASFYGGIVPTVKTAITVHLDGNITLHVHNREVSKRHEMWDYLPRNCSVTYYVQCLIKRIRLYSVCVGNPDEDMINLTPVGSGITMPGTVGLGAYREDNFNAVAGNLSYSSTVRHTECGLLVEGVRCANCRRVRDGLRARRNRLRQRSSGGVHKCMPNQFLSVEEKNVKLKLLHRDQKSLKRRIIVLEERVEKLEILIKKDIVKHGESLSSKNSEDLMDIMKNSQNYILKTFGPESFQRIFFEQQVKYNELRCKKGMRWHPSIIRWCLYLRSKSSKAYDGMRHLLALPSQRTLYDYSNATEAGIGFKLSVTEQLQVEAEKLNLYENEHSKYVGIVQDEVRIKSDLVFNKHTGELVGFVDLDSVGNELNDLENTLKGTEQTVARYMLVVMVRGITSSLQYPLAAFATDGITADFLYPIIWEAIQIIHCDVDLKVLFLCCDGASPNRKLFTLHSDNANSKLYKTANVFSVEEEDLYFISDVPHLLKTTRNCFSNSQYHKRSRLLWNGGNISWRHIVRLFEEHCKGDYRLCKKLTQQHVTLTPLSIMKVNLAAQVMSNTVAKALDLKYGDEVAATVEFISQVNSWFDVMNVRSLREAHRTRNPNVAPFTDANDPRLHWLENDFLQYFTRWSDRISQTFPQLSKSEKAAMQLSHQTLNGLHITTKSTVECVRFLLSKGANFVLTEHFNQDPLERHFGHYRQKGGLNENPSVWQVCHTLNQIRTVKCQGLAPKRGNVHVYDQGDLDPTPLPKRPRHNTV